jgi:hypothetical protein
VSAETPLATRALFALYRNHPSTAPGDRYGKLAHRRAIDQREMLLAWAATLSDEQVMDCRNLGIAALAWVRANQPRDGRPRHVHEGEWCAKCVEHGVAEEVRRNAAAHEPLDGVECDWDEDGKCRCRPPSVKESAERLGIPVTSRGLPVDIVHPAAFTADWSDPAMDVYNDDGLLRPEAAPIDHDIRCVDCGQPVGPGMVSCMSPGAGRDDQRHAKCDFEVRQWRDLAHAFRTYAQHSPNCAFQPTYPDTDATVCDCAFDVLLDRYDRLSAT